MCTIKKKKVSGGIHFHRNANRIKSETVIENDVL